VRLTIALWLALVTVAVPLLRVVGAGPWLAAVLLLPAVLLTAGFVLRRLRVPAVAVTLVELALWVGAVTALFFPSASLLGVVPTGDALTDAVAAVQVAANEINVGVAPIAPTAPVSFLIVAALGLLTIALDHVVLTARMPLLAGTALVIVWIIPAISVPADVDVLAFVLLAAALLYLVRAETRTREAPAMAAQAGGVTTIAATIGAVAIVGALMIGAAIPAPSAVVVGSGQAATIDPSLDLGDDLRAPGDTPVLTMHTDASAPPNLRVTTLSIFDGEVWQPDRSRSVSLTDEGLEPVVVADGIRVTEYRTSVDVADLSTPFLPIPYPAIEVSGLEGVWRAVPYSRTILTSESNAQGQSYDVISHVPRPTLEQIRSAPAVLEQSRIDVSSLPEGAPEIITRLAHEVTADQATAYDKLVALQTWFRGPEFTYSLDAPVDEGFDDAGVDAVAAFLDERSGYCVHFAGSFALMARALGMPSRVVVGFLPGAYTGEAVDDERVVEVTTAQLHAWPEVYFDGIGWVPFEPTKSLGTATRFFSASTPVDDAGQDVTGATPTPLPTASSTPTAADVPDDPASQGSTGAAMTLDVRPYLFGLLFALLLAAAPAAGAAMRRRALRDRRTVDAAWRLVQDAAIDVGAPVPAAESPRAFGARLSAVHGAPTAAMSRLVAAVEQASYAGGRGAPASRDLDAVMKDAAAVRAGMLATLDAGDRVRAVALPRSLVVRPGSAFADRGATA